MPTSRASGASKPGRDSGRTGTTKSSPPGNRLAAGNGARRSRPATSVVTQSRPWGLIAAALVVVLFAVGVIGYAVMRVNEAEANAVDTPDQITGIQTFDYANGQQHVQTPVDYAQTPPVGGDHAPDWADCTGTVYDGSIRAENAVHSQEHGAVWITYDPDVIADTDVSRLQELVEGRSGLMLSPYPGQPSPIMLQSWNQQLGVGSASDKRIAQFVDVLTFNAENTPEPGASCENPAFAANPSPMAASGADAGATSGGDGDSPGAP